MGSLKVDGSGELYWLEGRPKEGGRQVVCRYDKENAAANERGGVDVTPKGANVRTRVHEYGGGAHTLHPAGGVVYTDFQTQRLFWAKYSDAPAIPLTPEDGAHGWPDGQYRFADGQVDPSGARMVAVRENHGEKGDRKPSEVVNELVSIALDGSGEMVLLASGRDFYSNPRVSPSGQLLAYICWDHPSMPWDTTELRVASLAGVAPKSADTASHALVDGADGDTSVLQPAWHPATSSLYYLTDSSGFYNIRRVPPPIDGALATDKPGEALFPREIDFGGSAPGWVFGQQGYTFLADGRIAAHFSDRDTGRTQLLVFDEDTRGVDDVPAAAAASAVEFGVADGLPHSFGGLAPSADGTLYMIGGGPDIPSGVYAWRGLVPDASSKTAEQLACSTSNRVPDGYVSVPQPVEFPAPLGSSYGFYYPPTNPTASSDEAAPPLLVKAHGGPTACTSPSFNPSIQFWTSRGFAVLDVDYGGSTGYGREYRRRLRGSWGIVDIDDVCAGAQYLVSRGLADPKRLCIDGGSAGGYTTLGALAFKDVFTAGTSLYGVADLATLAGDTHKFESRYLDGLVGRYPEEAEVYAKRAPINSVETLSCPILLLQGDEDKIVPPNQAELMHKALLAKGIPTALKMYVGEQHGFRKAENIEDALNSEYYFYSRVFGFECAGDDVIPFTIDNLPVAA
jgi:dipeptidyl aminopeptidase/acylaminoacyl peptidase